MLPALTELADRHPLATGAVGTAVSFGSQAAGGFLETVSVWLSLATQIGGCLIMVMTLCLTWDKFAKWLRRQRRGRVDSRRGE